uniref:Mitochondrial inner membrane protease subunit 2 n=1 Tax=Gorilla gorilla gorilla TaxID=9595 RepID=A0A2I2YYT7_GORGO
MAQSQGWVKRYIKAFCKGFFVAVPVAVTFLDRVACVARVEGASMQSPKNPEQKIIKRVIALEGDIVRTIGHKNRYVKVPRGHIWVEGDHHGHSFDSNSFGPVSLGLLHAHATHILWPPERWQKLESVLPPERLPVQREEE